MFLILIIFLLVFQFLIARVVKVLELPIKNSGQKDHSFNGYWRLQLICPYCDGRCAGGNRCVFIAEDSGIPLTLAEEHSIHTKDVVQPKDKRQC